MYWIEMRQAKQSKGSQYVYIYMHTYLLNICTYICIYTRTTCVEQTIWWFGLFFSSRSQPFWLLTQVVLPLCLGCLRFLLWKLHQGAQQSNKKNSFHPTYFWDFKTSWIVGDLFWMMIHFDDSWLRFSSRLITLSQAGMNWQRALDQH